MMTRQFSAAPLITPSGVALAALFFVLGTQASAGIFGASKNDVAVKVVELRTQDSHAVVQGLDFSPDGSRLAEDSDGKFINMWDWRNTRVDKSIPAPGGFNAFEVANGLLYSPDGSVLAGCAGRGKADVFVYLWNTNDWSVAREITDLGVGGCDGIGFSPTGQFLVRKQRKVVKVIPTEAVGPLSWSPDRRRIAVSGGAGNVEIFDSESG